MKNSKLLCSELKEGLHEHVLQDIYLDKQMIPYQTRRYQEAIEQYEELFGEGEVEVYSAPGRSEIGGNHTDHQQGMVLAASINLDAIAVVGLNEKYEIEVVSKGYPPITLNLNDLEKKDGEEGSSLALLRGMVYGLKQKGYTVGGFKAYVTSDVLGGAGLSSSASYEVMIGTILSGLFHSMEIDPVLIAQIAQFAENVYFGKPCGLMDQMACSVGGMIHIDFENVKTPIVERVEVDFETFGHSLCIVDTKGDHADLTPDYAAIPAEMKEVAKYFGEDVLRNVNEEDFLKEIPKVREKVGDRPVLRALHFFEEEKRVAGQVEALRAHRFGEFLRLIQLSGDSSFKYLQNVYSPQHLQEQEMAIGLAVSQLCLQGHGVSRVHGGGFAGTLQAFVENSYVENYRSAMDHLFGDGACHPLKVRKYGGIKVL